MPPLRRGKRRTVFHPALILIFSVLAASWCFASSSALLRSQHAFGARAAAMAAAMAWTRFLNPLTFG